MFERSEFVRFPIYAMSLWEPEGQRSARSPFFAYFFWRSRKSEWLPGHPRR